MKKSITITDVTRMREGRVCVAGYDECGNCIRPVLPPPGILEHTLYARGVPIVFPFAVVEYELLEPCAHHPHIEDYRYDPGSLRLVKRLDDRARQAILDETLSKSVCSIFEQPILTGPGFYVMNGQGPRSLGTIRPLRVIRTAYEKSEDGKITYRLGFVDNERSSYWLAITDLAWRYYCDSLLEHGFSFEEISSQQTTVLKSSLVYLRIGLARSWVKFPERCYLQITAVYTFPDYLEGRTFADFVPN